MNPVLTNIVWITGYAWSYTTIAIMAFAAQEKKNAFAPVSATSHILFGDAAFSDQAIRSKFIISGLLLNLGAMLMWASITELVIYLLHMPANAILIACLVSVGITVAAYVTDFHIVPKRFTPGFEHVLSHRAVLLVYVFLALGIGSALLLEHLTGIA